MRNGWLISALALALAACAGSDNQGDTATARLIAPQSLATVTQQRPTLRWEATSDAMPSIDLCADRACSGPLAIGSELTGDVIASSGDQQVALAINESGGER